MMNRSNGEQDEMRNKKFDEKRGLRNMILFLAVDMDRSLDCTSKLTSYRDLFST